MNGIICDSQAKADAYSAAIDAKLGYPKAGIDGGGGYHEPGGGVTLRHRLVMKHPTLSQWAYPRDAIETAQAIALPIGATVQTLDATWFPAAGA